MENLFILGVFLVNLWNGWGRTWCWEEIVLFIIWRFPKVGNTCIYIYNIHIYIHIYIYIYPNHLFNSRRFQYKPCFLGCNPHFRRPTSSGKNHHLPAQKGHELGSSRPSQGLEAPSRCEGAKQPWWHGSVQFQVSQKVLTYFSVSWGVDPNRG